MDKRLVGKWYKEAMGETINIFGEEPLRMKISFSSSGWYNVDPNCIYESDGFLCWEINDEQFRMVYRVRFEDGKIVGTYTQFGRETEVEYERISETPEDGETVFIKPTSNYNGEPRIDILRRYTEYECGAEDIENEFKLFEPKPEILDKYDYDNYVAGKSGDELAFSLLRFVDDHFKHNGLNGLAQKRNIAGLIEFCEQYDMSTNCRGLAMLLASLLRMNGIKARHVTCLPYEEPCDDCHVVVDCLLPSGARVMLDPTFRLYIKDSAGEYVSLPRLREMLIAGEEYFPNADASYNGNGFDIAEQREYMIKNTFRFSRGTLSADGCDDLGRRCIELIPKNYPPEDMKFSDEERERFITDDLVFWKM